MLSLGIGSKFKVLRRRGCGAGCCVSYVSADKDDEAEMGEYRG